MSALQTVEPLAVVESQHTAAANVLSVIERAALDPNIDINKLERLLEMQERIIARDAKAAYAAAFAAMQPELPTIRERGKIKDKAGNVQSRYALWEDVNEAIRPILANHGFGLSFRTKTDDGKILVTGVLSHRAGHFEETQIALMADTSGSKNAVQSIGSSVSYGKRYTAGALLNLTSEYSEDDDGKAAGMAPVITDEQAANIRDLLSANDMDEAKFCAYGKIAVIEEMQASQYDVAIERIKAVAARKVAR